MIHIECGKTFFCEIYLEPFRHSEFFQGQPRILLALDKQQMAPLCLLGASKESTMAKILMKRSFL